MYSRRQVPRSSSRSRWAAVLVCAALVGCGEQGVPVPTDRFHRLTVEGPTGVYEAPRLEGILEVERFNAAGVLQGRQFGCIIERILAVSIHIIHSGRIHHMAETFKEYDQRIIVIVARTSWFIGIAYQYDCS